MSDIRIQVEVTTRCNHNCVYCPRYVIPETRTLGDITPEMRDLLVSRIAEIDEKYTPTISISGLGEVTLYPDLMGFIREIKSARNPVIRFNTNARYLHKVGSEIIDSQLVDYLSLSLSLPTEKLYEKYQGKNDFDVASRNMLNFLKEKGTRKPNTDVRFIDVPESSPHLEKAMKNWRRHVNKNDWVSKATLANWGGLVGEPLENKRNNPCRYQDKLLGKHLSINKEGYVGVCCFAVAVSPTHPFIIGNIKDYSINELIELAKPRALELIGSPTCENCITDITT